MEDRSAALKKAASEYRRAVERARQVEKDASAKLAEQMREAYSAGMKKADILRATDHVWSRTWLDNALKVNPTE